MFFSRQKEDDTTVSIYTEEELEDRENDNYLRPDDVEEELGKAMFLTPCYFPCFDAGPGRSKWYRT